MSRLPEAFQRARAAARPALAIFLTCGYPSLEETPDLVRAAVDGGADIIELGVPFSDPLADGATVQRANADALRHNVTLEDCFTTVATLRAGGLQTPIVLMGYYNPLLRYGLDRLAQRARQAGVDGLIVVDLPPEESKPLLDRCRPQGIDLVFLLAPTSSEARVDQVARIASGFIYLVSVTGITGVRQDLPPTLPDLAARIRKHTALPLAIGFGISRREHVQQISRYADAAVVGSAVINAIDGAAGRDERPKAVRDFVAYLSGRATAVGGERQG